MAMGRLTRDEGRRIAVNIEKLPQRRGSAFRGDCKRLIWSSEHFGMLVLILRTVCPNSSISTLGGRAMFARKLFTDTMRLRQALTTSTVLLVFVLAALPAHAQNQYPTSRGLASDRNYSRFDYRAARHHWRDGHLRVASALGNPRLSIL
jgi:hypothetical protein